MALQREQAYTIEDIYALPDGQRAELIDGQIYMITPPKTIHQKLISKFVHTITNFIDHKSGDCISFQSAYGLQHQTF